MSHKELDSDSPQAAESLRVTAPLTDDVIRSLRAGTRVLLSGTVYTARDAAHKRMMQAVDAGEPLPIPADGTVIFYVGPTPARPGLPIGSAGPTTSGRMDAYAPRLMALGYRVMVGKGARAPEVKRAIRVTGSVYLAAIGGAGAIAGRCVTRAEVVAYGDLGPEAIYKLSVQDMPLVVINDSEGGDLYEAGKAQFREESKLHAI